MQERILIIDDEPQIVRLARDYLEKNGFRVLTAGDGPTGLALAKSEKPDLVVLDILLPGMDGREVCRALRQHSDVPILMLTALSGETDQIAGLELGADDYISKPFSPRALVARVRAALRRAQQRAQTPNRIIAGELEIDTEHHAVTYRGRLLHFTPNEFKLLAHLALHTGQTITREQLAQTLHGTFIDSTDRSIDSHVKNLRRKFESDPGNTIRIETVYGIGYRLEEGASG